jgi:putative membrane protein
MGILINLLVSAIAVVVCAYVIPGVAVDSIWTALIVAVVLGVLNAFIKPILSILTLPITILTLGLFSLVINALIIMLVDWLVPGFTVDGFIPALIFSIGLSLISSLLHSLTRS